MKELRKALEGNMSTLSAWLCALDAQAKGADATLTAPILLKILTLVKNALQREVTQAFKPYADAALATDVDSGDMERTVEQLLASDENALHARALHVRADTDDSTLLESINVLRTTRNTTSLEKASAKAAAAGVVFHSGGKDNKAVSYTHLRAHET